MSAIDALTFEELIDLGRTEESRAAFDAAGASCSWCAEPVRLSGGTTGIDTATGEVVQLAGGPGRIYYKACGSRRATRCPACAERYRMDARIIVLSGLRGEKGTPEEVRGHPAVFATLTAPSFGAVHRARERGGRRLSCRGGSSGPCAHGRPRTCGLRHRAEESCVGEALCPDCYDYEHQVLWNALAPELWRRVTIYCTRILARSAGTSEKGLRALVRLSFVKVAEYQRRGVVHLHVVARLDPVDDNVLPETLGANALGSALGAAVRQVALAYPGEETTRARFGEQLDVQVLSGFDDDRTARSVAGYLGKYATKGSDDNGALDRRLRSQSDAGLRRLPEHLRRLVLTAWRLGGELNYAELGLRRFAHALGFRGHWMTKSRRWSTTFKMLHGERIAWRSARRQSEAPARSSPPPEIVSYQSAWRYEGRGWVTGGEAWLARERDRDRHDGMQLARELRAINDASGRWAA